MDDPFPFGLPFPTAFYLVLYIATLLVHLAFMAYVLAGTAYVAVDLARRRLLGHRAPACPIAETLRDWMPFMLSGAITAGVAPLLFLQILYKGHFYTANLLLQHRWMAILPVLILAFYLLYVLKAGWSAARPGLRAVAGAIAALCFLFIAWSWVENHVLGLHPESWAAIYERRPLVFVDRTVLARLTLWCLGAVPGMATIAAWQVHGLERLDAISPDDSRRAAHRLATIALGALGLWIGAAAAYATLGAAFRTAASSGFALPYVAAAGAGFVLQIVAWTGVRIRGSATRLLWLGSLGWLTAILGFLVVRERVRLAAVDLEALAESHRATLGVDGMSVFLIFTVLAGAATAWAIAISRRAVLRGPDDPPVKRREFPRSR